MTEEAALEAALPEAAHALNAPHVWRDNLDENGASIRMRSGDRGSRHDRGPVNLQSGCDKSLPATLLQFQRLLSRLFAAAIAAKPAQIYLICSGIH
jgi:hypothetical protein